MADIVEVLERYKDVLMAIPGCEGVAIAYKQTGGEQVEQLAIVVYVREKSTNVSPADLVPSVIEGFQTDVVENSFGMERTATDPFARFDRLISGISITPRHAPAGIGTIGLFIHTTGNNQVPPADYLLTCQHVVEWADPNSPNHGSRIVIQPGRTVEPAPADLNCGDYVHGVLDPTNDCAITTVGYGRTWRNEVPNAPGHPGNKRLRGIAAAAVGDLVYKYGATTRYTRGVVQAIHFHHPVLPMQDAIVVTSPNGTTWAAGGDSGSVVVRQVDDFVIGLNFAINPNTVVLPAGDPLTYSTGYAHDIQAQMANFGGVVGLA